MDRGRTAKGVTGSHDGSIVPLTPPPAVPHMGRIPGGRGEALGGAFSRPPAARTGTGRHRARPARVVEAFDQRLLLTGPSLFQYVVEVQGG